jgi:hypothetical protein
MLQAVYTVPCTIGFQFLHAAKVYHAVTPVALIDSLIILSFRVTQCTLAFANYSP